MLRPLFFLMLILSTSLLGVEDAEKGDPPANAQGQALALNGLQAAHQAAATMLEQELVAFREQTLRAKAIPGDRKQINSVLNVVITLGELPYGGASRIRLIRDILQSLMDIHAKYARGTQERVQALEELYQNAASAYAQYVRMDGVRKVKVTDSADALLKAALNDVQATTHPNVMTVLTEYLHHTYRMNTVGFKVGASIGIGGAVGPIVGTLKDAFGRRHMAIGGTCDVHWGAGAGIGFVNIHAPSNKGMVRADNTPHLEPFAIIVGGGRDSASGGVGSLNEIDIYAGGRGAGDWFAKAAAVCRLPKIDYAYFRMRLGLE